MTIAFVSFFVERISLKAGLWLLLPLILLGISSVAYWNLTELHGRGDLRPYGYVQAYPLLGVPLIIFLFPACYTRTADLLRGWNFMFWPRFSSYLTVPFMISAMS